MGFNLYLLEVTSPSMVSPLSSTGLSSSPSLMAERKPDGSRSPPIYSALGAEHNNNDG
jgi:hypothetical protein